MKYLLDLNMLLAAIWQSHPQHTSVTAWITGKELAVCPICELGFLRISTNPKAFNSPMDIVRQGLENFCAQRRAEFIPDDLPGLQSHAKTSGQVTDHYLADLAKKHGLKLATMDAGLKHPAVELVS